MQIWKWNMWEYIGSMLLLKARYEYKCINFRQDYSVNVTNLIVMQKWTSLVLVDVLQKHLSVH